MLLLARRGAALAVRRGRPLSGAAFNGRFDPETRVVRSPFDADPLPQCSITQLLWKHVHKWETKTAITCGVSGRSLTYGELHGASRNLSINLPPLLGLRPGDVVGLVLPNCPEYPIAFYGCLAAGLVVSPANPLYTPGELCKQFADAKVRAVVTLRALVPQVAEALAQSPSAGAPLLVADDLGGDFQGAIALSSVVRAPQRGAAAPEPPPPEALAVLPYSSGTTGAPKGVEITHRNLVAGLCIADHPQAISNGIDDGQQNCTLAVIPFYHIYGSVIIVGVCLHRGYHVVTVPKFDPQSFVANFKKSRPTHIFLVPPLMLFVARCPDITAEDMSNLKLVVSGAAPLSNQVMDEFLQKAPSRMIFKSGYGLTETTCLVTAMPEDMEGSRCESLGPPGVMTEVKVIDGGGKALPLGEVGELCVRGPQIVRGYLGNPAATSAAITPDGWLCTGDLAFIDKENVHVHVVDRLKELIKVKGFQVSPVELENILIEMEGIADVAVLGVADEVAGELPLALVVRQPGAQLTEEQVSAFLRPKVAAFKQIAAGVKFVDSIPKSAAGKILRRQLRGLL